MLSVDIALPEVEELQRLVEQGLEKGFLTYDEIVAGLDEVELTKEQVEDGAQRPLGPALAAFLLQLGLESGGLADAPLANSRGEVVGALTVTA